MTTQVTIQSELKRRMDLVNDSKFRNVAADFARQMGVTAKEWNENRAAILMLVANKFCAIENEMAQVIFFVIMKADERTANELISKYYDIIGSNIKVKKNDISQKHLFEATELICKGYALIEVRTTYKLNKNQKSVLCEIIKGI